MKKKYNHRIDRVVASLSRKHDCYIEKNTIQVLRKDAHDRTNCLGNGSWGKIDFLTKYCDYKLVFVPKLLPLKKLLGFDILAA